MVNRGVIVVMLAKENPIKTAMSVLIAAIKYYMVRLIDLKKIYLKGSVHRSMLLY